ncbi:DNA-dependent ATPase fun30 [Cladophialophora chaetospira]|uniref:DNA helicase n=1 Tax=Cladophialophora chaetospira TaxID=386627 RepID=A0AA38XLT5_9EURO|nr:DNA-dependent ATPase fun30 [Cladophialophora chaetospira]
MASDDSLSQSDEELFNPNYKPPYETVETVPLPKATTADDDSDFETLATLPLNRPTQTRQTQPTQLIDRSPANMFSPSKPASVQVAASSPMAPAPPVERRRTGILANAMAPAGTAFRRPFVAPQSRPTPITIDSDDEGPTYKGGSSDSDEPRRRNDIKTSTFVRKRDQSPNKIPESPQPQNDGRSRFMELTARAVFRGSPASTSSGGSTAVKRSADINANAYGNVSKKPRQTAPARALPLSSSPPGKVARVEEMELDDISDWNMRQKINRMLSMLKSVTVKECYEVLILKKGDYDNAVDELLLRSEKRPGKNGAVDLTLSDDELMPTPAATKPAPSRINLARQQAKAPQRTIAEKWSSTQNVRKPSKAIDVFDAPPPQKKRTLVRGRRLRSSSPPAIAPESKATAKPQHIQAILSDDSDAAESVISSDEQGNGTFTGRVLELFNNCSAADLADMASINRDLAEHIISKRPFKTVDAVKSVEDLKPPKGRRKKVQIGEKVVDKVMEMLQSYEAVDFLVEKCQNLAKPLSDEMKSWGVKVANSQSGELDLVSLQAARSSHDSGIGTPVSDEEDIKRSGQKIFIKQPSLMASDMVMKDYQVVGLNWLNLLYSKGLSCILADDMGLGKTCQVIAFLAHLFEQGRMGPHLVVVPAATLENWLKEFQRFCPALNVEPYYSTNPQERFQLRDTLDENRDDVNVIITTYTLAKGKEDQPWLRNFGFDCTVYDEGHVLKNASSQVARQLTRIRSNFRLLLTGTPLQNNLKELISLLGFLMPGLFKEKAEELETIFTHNFKALDNHQEMLLSTKRIQRARSMLTPFILRRKKFQVLKDLPKKERRTEICDLTPEQAELYQLWLDKAYEIRDRRERGENVSNESTNVLMKLRFAALHPFLFRRLYPDKKLPVIAKQCVKVDLWRESNPNLIVKELHEYSDMEIHSLCDKHSQLQKFALNGDEWRASGKVQKMLELLHKFIAEGHRTLIFSQFVLVLDILELVLEREAIGYFRLDGSTKVTERQDLIDEFCAEDNDTPVFMLSTKAGGAGINLAKANKVIIFDSGFNPQDDIQAENRAHRIGQEKDVEVIRLVSRGTVEEQIHAMGLTKLKLDEQVAGDGEEQPPRKEGEESEKEVEGRIMVEDMLFKKLETEPIEQVKAEASSPVQEKFKLEEIDFKSDGDRPSSRKGSVDLPSRMKVDAVEVKSEN